MPADGSWTPAYWHPSAWCGRVGNQTPDLVVTGEVWLRQDCQQVAEAVGLVLGKESQPLALCHNLLSRYDGLSQKSMGIIEFLQCFLAQLRCTCSASAGPLPPGLDICCIGAGNQNLRRDIFSRSHSWGYRV